MTTAPKSATKVPADTSVFVPVLPEAVPMFAQVKIIQRIRLGEHLSVVKVPDVVVAPQQVTGGIQKVQISQVRILKHLNFFFLVFLCKIWNQVI